MNQKLDFKVKILVNQFVLTLPYNYWRLINYCTASLAN